VIDRERVRAWAAEHGVADRDDLAAHPAVHELIAGELELHSRDFRSYERPRAFVITGDELTTDNDMLTPTLKLKRRNAIVRYGAALAELYTGRLPAWERASSSTAPAPSPPSGSIAKPSETRSTPR
jgi:long-chain acyl-CoA synthetase